MKTGLILYFVGNDAGKDLDGGAMLEQMSDLADRVEIVSGNSGHFDVHDAWWALTARGMHRIVCRIAELTDSGTVRLTAGELRLCG